MDAAELHARLKALVADMPLLEVLGPPSPEVQQWLGRAHSLVALAGISTDPIEFRLKAAQIGDKLIGASAARTIQMIVHRALAHAELRAPTAAQGTFIAARSPFDVLQAVGDVFRTAGANILVVDPYLDDQFFAKFAPFLPESVEVRLLTDEGYLKATLVPAFEAWKKQYGTGRSVELRAASPARSLHDRDIVIDERDVWLISQSFNGIGGRADATIQKADADTAQLKVAAFQSTWSRARAVP